MAFLCYEYQPIVESVANKNVGIPLANPQRFDTAARVHQRSPLLMLCTGLSSSRLATKSKTLTLRRAFGFYQ